MTVPPLLSSEERQRFGAYLLAEAETAAGISAQIYKLHLSPVMSDLMVKQERLYETSCRIIAARLLTTTDDQIG